MKLRKLYEQILNELGDISEVPSGATFRVHEYEGIVNFAFLGNTYKLSIRLPIKQGNKAALTVDFTTNELSDELTNKGQALKVMSYIVGCIEEWLRRYKKYYLNNDALELMYIMFNPKSEYSELGKESDDGVNKRDRIYRMYIDKFAKNHGSTVAWSTSGGVIAKFTPNIIIK